jgi:hypothetical protein
MTYDIRIKLKKEEVLPDVFDWIHQQGWKHIQEWRWFRVGMDGDSDRDFMFQFDDEKHAEWFSLRWL